MSELASSIVELVGAVLGSVVVTIVGIALERAAVAAVLAGELALGAWEVAAGLLALYVGVYLLAYQKVWPQIGSRRQSGT